MKFTAYAGYQSVNNKSSSTRGYSIAAVLRRVIVEFLFSSLECSSSGRCCRGASRHGTYVSGNNDVQ